MNYLEELEKISSFLEIYWFGFPHQSCIPASDLVERVLDFPVVIGFFHYNKKRDNHTWNINPESQEIIDLSAYQYPEIEERVLILPPNTREREHYVVTNINQGLYNEDKMHLEALLLDNFERYKRF